MSLYILPLFIVSSQVNVLSVRCSHWILAEYFPDWYNDVA